MGDLMVDASWKLGTRGQIAPHLGLSFPTGNFDPYNRFEVLPHVSTMQLAFARVKESWEDSFLTNLANRDVEAVLEPIWVRSPY